MGIQGEEHNEMSSGMKEWPLPHSTKTRPRPGYAIFFRREKQVMDDRLQVGENPSWSKVPSSQRRLTFCHSELHQQ